MTAADTAARRAPTTTQIGIATTRLPAGAARIRLLRLAQRGSEVCRRSREDTRGHRLLTLLCDTLFMALTELSIAERSVAAAQVRIAELQRRIGELSFDEPTRKGEPSDETRAALRSR